MPPDGGLYEDVGPRRWPLDPVPIHPARSFASVGGATETEAPEGAPVRAREWTPPGADETVTAPTDFGHDNSSDHVPALSRSADSGECEFWVSGVGLKRAAPDVADPADGRLPIPAHAVRLRPDRHGRPRASALTVAAAATSAPQGSPHRTCRTFEIQRNVLVLGMASGVAARRAGYSKIWSAMPAASSPTRRPAEEKKADA